jgi:hypothetical protein
MSARDVQFFMHMREQIKLYHWQTRVYARHKSTDEVLESLDKSIDKYVEVYMGSYGRMKLTGDNARITLMNLSETSIVRFIKRCIDYLENDLVKKLKPTNTDLINIRDEMLAELNQLLYLFTLN